MRGAAGEHQVDGAKVALGDGLRREQPVLQHVGVRQQPRSIRLTVVGSGTVVPIGSSKSKPRKGHEHPQHLPKVGTPNERAWAHQEHEREVFGGGWVRIGLAILVIMGMVGLVFLIF